MLQGKPETLKLYSESDVSTYNAGLSLATAVYLAAWLMLDV